MKTLALWLLVLVVTAAGRDGDWKTYKNERFGFSVQIPESLIASRAPDNGAGQEFHTKNGEFSILAHAHFMAVADESETIDTRWKDALKELGDTVSYKRKTATWYVLSGTTKDGTEFYYKFHVQDKNWAEIRITYPHSKAKQYDPWVEKIAKHFAPFLKGDFDRIER